MANIFETNQATQIPKRNLFDLSVENLCTANMGYLYPVFTEHLMPGDKFQLSPSAVIKTAPFVNPLFGQINVDFHCFVVPYRLLWDKWSDWIYDTSKSDLVPHLSLKYILSRSFGVNFLRDRDTFYGTLADFLGYNYGKDINSDTNWDSMDYDYEVNIFPFLAYHQIYNENFRDEDLIPAADWLKEFNRISDWNDIVGSDVDSSEFFSLRRRSYRKDYFTSARPWPQKGTVPSMGVELTGRVPVRAELGDKVEQSYHNFLLLGIHGEGGTSTTTFPAGVHDIIGENTSMLAPTISSPSNAVFTNGEEQVKVFADLNGAELDAYFNIQQFRNMFAIQRWFEINAVSGSRYIEGTRAYWGVDVKDARAQIPEFLGYQTSVVQLSEVLQHDESNGSAIRGTRSAVGNVATFGKPWRYYATENSIVMVLMSIRPTTNYSQGLSRKLRMLTQFDFPFHQFQQLGEQPVYNYEIFNDMSVTANEDEFGYQSRYAEWRSSFNEVHGDFKGTLRDWTLFRKFLQTPSLGQSFIEISNAFLPNFFPTMDDSIDNFMCDLYFKFKVLRPLKYHTMPAIIG